MKTTLLTSIATLFITLTCYSQIGSFTIHDINSTGAYPYVIDSGNLNGDAYPDIVVGTLTGGTVEIYMNYDLNVAGDFTTPPISKSLSQVTGIHIADLDGVNGNDIIASSYDGDKLVWYENNGDGTFQDEQIISSSVDGSGAIVTGQIDAGATLDVAVVVYGGDGDTDRVVWFANDGSWTESDIVTATAGTGPGDLDMADIDKDGDLDVVVAFTDGGNVELYYNDLVPGGSVSFTKDLTSISIGNTYLFDISFADVNDDTELDILKVDLDASGEIAVYYNDGSESFTEQIINDSHPYPSSVIAADLNKDTLMDIVAVDGLNQNDDVFWFESSAIATKIQITDANLQNQIFEFTINDFDNDGYLDLATIGAQSNNVKWIENQLDLLSINDNTIDKISIYPNPTTDKLNFKSPLANSFKVSVYDILGKKVIQETVSVTRALDVSDLHSGIYIIKFNGYDTTYKFIKQ